MGRSTPHISWKIAYRTLSMFVNESVWPFGRELFSTYFTWNTQRNVYVFIYHIYLTTAETRCIIFIKEIIITPSITDLSIEPHSIAHRPIKLTWRNASGLGSVSGTRISHTNKRYRKIEGFYPQASYKRMKKTELCFQAVNTAETGKTWNTRF